MIPVTLTFAELASALAIMMDYDEHGKVLHAWRVALVAEVLARDLLPNHRAEVFYAGLLHDVGGVGAANHIIHYPTIAAQMADPIIRHHPIRGAQIVRSIPGPFPGLHLIADMILDHHEWWDGSGYPNQKKGEEILVGGHILRLADDFDARHHYYPSLKLPAVLEHAKRSGPGHEFSPEMFAVLMRSFAEQRDFYEELFAADRLPDLLQRASASLPEPGSLSGPDLLERALNLFAELVDAKHPYLVGHSRRVSEFATQLARALGLPEEEVTKIKLSGFLHDVGKVGVPRRIIDKAGPLDAAEWAVIKQHPLRGEEIVKSLHGFQELSPIVKHEHEHYDGGGYPIGLRGEEIPLLARVIAVADAFDALTSLRPYHAVRTAQAALQVLREESGRTFDPAIVSVAQDLFGPALPPG
ncbi:MAG: HD domain-containing protein [Chloroflexi bacterium]|nr:HD domain-containing protein [Chloroflexota bacterium]